MTTNALSELYLTEVEKKAFVSLKYNHIQLHACKEQ